MKKIINDERLEEVMETGELRRWVSMRMVEFDGDCEVEDRDHILNMCASLARTRLGLQPTGGGFIQAVDDDSLVMSYAMADNVNRKYLEVIAAFAFAYLPSKQRKDES